MQNYRLVLRICAVLLLTLFVVLSYYTHFAADDFFFIASQKTIGTLATVNMCYTTFSGRWVAYALTAGLLETASNAYFLPVFTLAIFILSLYTCYLCVIRICFFASITITKSESLLYAVLFLGSFFFASFSIAETWFWYTAVCSYLISLLLFLLLLNELISPNNSFAGYFILLFAPIYIGGASESFAIVSCIILFLISLVAYFKFDLITSIRTSFQIRKISIAIVLLLLSFGFTAMAPGNELRHSQLPHPGVAYSALIPLKALFKCAYLFLMGPFWKSLLFCIPWFFIGADVKNRTVVTGLQFLKKTGKAFLVFILFCFLMLVPASVILSETPPARALSQLSFLIGCSLSLWFLIAGMSLKISNKQLLRFKVIHACCLLTFLVYTLFSQTSTLKKYDTAYRQRMEILSQNELKTGIAGLKLDPLPSSGMLYSAELSQDSTFYTNRHLQKAMGIKYGIFSRSSPE